MAFVTAAHEWHVLLRDVDEAFVNLHLESAMKMTVALHCADDAAVERAAEAVSDTDQRGFLALVMVLRRLVEVAVREHMTFLLPSVTCNDSIASSSSLKTELNRQQTLVQSLPDAFQLRFRQLLESHWDSLTQAAESLTFSLPRVQQLHWKVAAKSDTGRRVLVRLQTSDGKTRTIHVPMQQFHQLRHGVATVLQEMNEVEAHPMMRLAYMEQNSQTTTLSSLTPSTVYEGD